MPRQPLRVAAEDPIPLYAGDVDEDLQVVSRNQLAEKITGGLSFTEKMPCPSIGISASRCKIGSLLRDKPGSTCASCYALKGRYSFGKVQDALERRYEGLFNPLWTPSLVFLIRWYAAEYFRLFDSGDLQSPNHLRNLVTVAKHVPDVKTWLPTREAEIVRTVLKEIGEFPENLVVRVSAAMVDGKAPKGFRNTSSVVGNPDEATCRAHEQGNSCGECRACWDPSVKNVSYALH